MGEVRVGQGLDVHRFAPGRPLMLGGVLFEGDGLAGHSDGDAICHALADALLGAAGLGDLGEHFPDTDPRFEGMGGLDLLARVVAKVRVADLVPSSADLIVLAERPAVAPARDQIRRSLAAVLGVSPERVSVKATRPEGLGLTGDGVGCLALALMQAR